MTRHENGPRKPTGRTIAERKVARRKPPSAEAPESVEAASAVVPVARQRIAKLMARVGLCSRRDAEAWIVEGRVTLNGEVLTSPAQDVGQTDVILVDGMPLPEAEKTRLFLFHKPRGLVTSDHDPEGRQTVTDYLRETWPEGPRVVTIGRLDINTEGLLLLTNDGGLARVLELPATGWVRRYRVRAKGETNQGVLDRLHDGVTIEGIEYAGIEAKLDRMQGANSWLTMGLREGKNREIKRVLEHIGLEVNRLIRLSFGPFQLLDLPEGKVEEVRTRVLRDQLGESLAAEAGVDLPEDPVAPAFRAETRILTRAERTGGNKAGKEMVRDRKGGAATAKPRTGDQRLPRRTTPDVSAPREELARRERPVAGTRKHISSLRAEETADRRKGPRKRIERTDTKDRKDRTINVERMVAARPEPRTRRGAARFAPRDATPESRTERPARNQRQENTAREPSRERGRVPDRDHASPSALAKRVRVARSGGNEKSESRATRPAHDRPERQPRGERPLARDPTGGKARSIKPWRDESPSQEAGRRTESERTRSPSRTEKPAREGTGDRREGRAAGFATTTRRTQPDKPRAQTRADAPSHSGKPKGEKPRNAGAERRVGERNAGERDARKSGGKFVGKRDSRGRGGDTSRDPKGPPRPTNRGPRTSKPRD